MVKAFSVASWNVKHFRDDPEDLLDDARVKRVIDYVKNQGPDVFAIYEVKGKEVYRDMVDAFPKYVFQITEGEQSQEILVGVRDGFTCFFTQRTEFRSGVRAMRPGLLASIRLNEIDYSLLFLHLASFPEPRGFGLRDDMLAKALKLRGHLDDQAGGKFESYYMFLGDLNVMGMKYPFKRSILPDTVLRRWDARAQRYWKMRNLPKTHSVTWRGRVDGKVKRSNLDHVFASTNLQFKKFDIAGIQAEVDVRGWVEADTNAGMDEWIGQYSDHSLLFFEVQAVESETDPT